MTESNNSIDTEERVDESTLDGFRAMGLTSVSDNTVKVYKAFKIKKDKLHPGRLTPEALATIVVLGEMADGKLNFVSSNVRPADILEEEPEPETEE